MKGNKNKKLPQFKSVPELVKFFDTHDMGDYAEHMPEVTFDVKLERNRHLFTIPDDIAQRVTKIARSRKLPSELLIHTWLREKVAGKV